MALNDELKTREKFARECMSNESEEDFLAAIGKKTSDYKPIHLSATYIGKEGEDFVYETELKLADNARLAYCAFVTNMDYVKIDYKNRGSTITARGLVPKVL